MAPEPSSQPTGLAVPGTGPEFKSRERDDERRTRKPMVLWDRIKFLLLLAALWLFFVLAAMGDNPILSFRDAVSEQLRAKWWLVTLGALEVLRQIHYLICEHSEGYHRFWNEKVFRAFDQRTAKINDWNRFRISRLLKWAFAIVIAAFILAAVLDTTPVLALVELPSTIFGALPDILQLFFIIMLGILQFAAIFWFLSKGGIEVYFPDDVKTRFTDVWGQDSVLEKVKENIVYLEDPESIEKKGGYVPGGILLWGPPGTGKTLMAEAVAGETGRPYVFVDPGAFTNMFIGVGILKVKSLFRKLRKLAVRYGGVIVFFDEADSLGNRGMMRGGGGFGQMVGHGSAAPACNGLSYVAPDTASVLLRHEIATSSGPEAPRRGRDGMFMGMGGDMGTLQALLAALSGLKKPRGFMNRVVRRALGMRPKPPPKYRILVMMATNMPEALDDALLRPGRIDRIYKVGYPSKPGRIRTYEGYLAKVRHELTSEDIDKLATITPYATGATIKDLVNESLITAIRSGRDAITWPDVVKAKQLKDLGPPEDVEYIERERHAVAVHEACHAVTAYRVRRHLTIDVATIEKGGTYLGMVASIKPEDQFTQWRSEYEADIMVSVASLVGERMFFEGDNSSGVSGDLESATRIALLMEGYWGMGASVTSVAVAERGIRMGRQTGGGQDHESPWDLMDSTLGERAEQNLARIMERTAALLDENRQAVLAVAHALETHKTLTGDDIEAIIEGRPGVIVDGSPYGRPEFLRVAEEYHSRVLTAHQGHGKVDVPLPLLNGQRARHPEFERPSEPEAVELTEAELAGRSWRPPTAAPPEAETDGGNGSES